MIAVVSSSSLNSDNRAARNEYGNVGKDSDDALSKQQVGNS